MEIEIEISFTILGVVLFIASLVGGNVVVAGVSIPTLKSPFIRVVIGLVGVCLVLIAQFAYINTVLTNVVECSETEPCKGIPIACKTSNENPKESLVGNIWLPTAGTEESKTKNLPISDVRFGPWVNPQCEIHEPQIGWNAEIGTCQNLTGEGRQRCVAVQVKQSLSDRWF